MPTTATSLHLGDNRFSHRKKEENQGFFITHFFSLPPQGALLEEEAERGGWGVETAELDAPCSAWDPWLAQCHPGVEWPAQTLSLPAPSHPGQGAFY